MAGKAKAKERANGTADDLTAEQATAALMADKRRREREALQAIGAILERCNVRLVPVFMAKGGQVQQSVEVVAND